MRLHGPHGKAVAIHSFELIGSQELKGRLPRFSQAVEVIALSDVFRTLCREYAMNYAGSISDCFAPPGWIAAEFTLSLQAINEELSVVGMSLAEEVFFFEHCGTTERRCYLTCVGDAAPPGSRALVTFLERECHAFTDGPQPTKIASLAGADMASVFDFLLAVVEALATQGRIPQN